MPDLPVLSARIPLLGWILRRWRWLWGILLVAGLGLPVGTGVFLAWREWHDPTLVLRAVDLPYAWEEAGHRGPALATHLTAALAQLQDEAADQHLALAQLAGDLPLRIQSETNVSAHRWRRAILYARQRLSGRPLPYLNMAILAGPDSVRLLVQRAGQPGPRQVVVRPAPPQPLPPQRWIDAFLMEGLLALATEADPVWGAWLAWASGEPVAARQRGEWALRRGPTTRHRAWASLLLSRLAIAEGRYAVALTYCEAARAAGLRPASLWLAQAEALAGLGREAAADSAFAEAVRPPESRAQALAQWAAHLLATGQGGAASDRLAEAHAAAPGSVPILLAWAKLLRQQGLGAAAREKYETALGLAPGDPAVVGPFAALLEAEGQALEAARRPLPALERYLRRWELQPAHPAAGQPLDRALGLMMPPLVLPWDSLPAEWQGRLVGAGLARAAAALKAGEVLMGERWLEALTARFPEEKRITQQHARWLWAMIQDSVAAGALASAQRRYYQLQYVQPLSPPQAGVLAQAVQAQVSTLQATGAWEAAAAGYRLLDELGQVHVVHLLAWATVQEAQGDIAAAEASYARAYQMDVDLEQVVVAWADMLVRQRAYDRAWEKFALARKLAPADPVIAQRWGDALLAAGGGAAQARAAYAEALPLLDTADVSAYRRAAGYLHAQLGYCAQVVGDFGARAIHYAAADSFATALIDQPAAGDDSAAGYYLQAVLAGHQRRAVDLERRLDDALAQGWPVAAVSREAEPFRRFPIQVERALGPAGP